MEPPDFMKRIIDFERFLEGENRDNFDADDVRHWRAVYTDLVRFKEELLGQTSDGAQAVSISPVIRSTYSERRAANSGGTT